MTGSDSSVDKSVPSETDAGRVSNVGLVTFCVVFLTLSLVGVIILIILKVSEKPTVPMFASLAAVSLAFGCLLGPILLLMPKRTFVIRWDNEGLACRTGWVKFKELRCPWSEVLGVNLFLGAEPRKGQRPYLLVIILPRHEVRIIGMDQFWKKITPLIDALSERLKVNVYEYNPEFFDNGPCIRLRVSWVDAASDISNQNSV